MLLVGPISHTSTQYIDFVDFLYFTGFVYYVMVGWLTVKDKTCVTYDSHVNQDSTSLHSAHAPRSSSYKGA